SGRRENAHRLAVEEGPDVVDDVAEIQAIVFHADVTKVGGDDRVIQSAKWVIEGQRLDVEHIQPGSGDPVLLKHAQQRLFVDDRATRGIDDVGGRLHQSELLRADQAARTVGELHVDGDKIRVAKQVFLGGVFDSRLAAFVFGEIGAPGRHLHAERFGD